MAVCVAVLDRHSTPLALATSDPEKELDFHYIVHTSIDVINEKTAVNPSPSPASPSPSSTKLDASSNLSGNRELYLGVLYSTEQYKVFGYVTNTKIKFILIVQSTLLRDNEIRQMFRKLHIGYASLLSNPFYVPGTPIQSKKFSKVVESLMADKTSN